MSDYRHPWVRYWGWLGGIMIMPWGAAIAHASPIPLPLRVLQPLSPMSTILASTLLAVDPMFPDSVRTAVLQAAAAQTGLPQEHFTLAGAQAKTWSDACLGLAGPDEMCAAVLVEGWEVTLTHDRQEWVFRTNYSGQIIKLDPAGSHSSRLIAPVAEQIPPDQLPPKLDKAVVFREVRSGGFAGLTEEITLYKAGRLERRWLSGPSVPDPTNQASGSGTVTRALSQQAVKAFKSRLYQLKFGQFGGLRYPAPPGAADYFRVTLTNGQTTVQYADLNLEELPQDLQSSIQAWQALVSEGLR